MISFCYDSTLRRLSSTSSQYDRVGDQPKGILEINLENGL